jgi:hypothetical protein
MPMPPTPGAPPPPDGVPPPPDGVPTEGTLGVGVLGTDTVGVEGTLGAVTLGTAGTSGTVTLGTAGISGTETPGTEGTLGDVIVGKVSGTVPGGSTGLITGAKASWINPIGGLRTLGWLGTLGTLTMLVVPVGAGGATLTVLVPTGLTAALSRRS